MSVTGVNVVEHTDRGPLSRNEIAALIAGHIPAGSYVNLGIGLPTLVADHLGPDAGVILHTENGMLGMGAVATGDDIDPDLTNAGKIPVLELPGAAYFHHADSFAMMRGGHLDVCVLGAFQVSATGDLVLLSSNAIGVAKGHTAYEVTFGAVLATFVPRLRAAGVGEDDLRRILVTNPAALLTVRSSEG